MKEMLQMVTQLFAKDERMQNFSTITILKE